MLSRAFANQSGAAMHAQACALPLPSNMQVLQTNNFTSSVPVACGSKQLLLSSESSPCGSFGEDAVFEISCSSSPSKGSKGRLADHQTGRMSTDAKPSATNIGEEPCLFEAELEETCVTAPFLSPFSSSAQTAIRVPRTGDIRKHFPVVAG